MSCPECEKKDRIIRILNEQSMNYKKEHHIEAQRSEILCSALNSIYQIAKDKMWWPSNFKERGETGVSEQDKRYSKVQETRPHCVETDR